MINSKKDLLIDLLVDCLGSFFIAVSVQVFAANANFAPGGVNGIAVIVNYLLGLPIGAITLVVNIPIILLCFKHMGWKFLFKSLKTMVICAFFMDYVAPILPGYTGEPLLAAVFTGLMGGIGYALIYMRNSSTGGSDFLILTLNKLKPHLSIGTITQVIDGSVIIVGGFVFKNVDAVLFGIISTIVSTIVIDRIMLGASTGKVAFIISQKSELIAEKINTELKRGTTYINAKGYYSKEPQNIVFCACAQKELYKMKKVVSDIDENAFVVVTESKEVLGQGFNKLP